MSIVINQATWGDETSATDITADLQKQASGGYLSTTANNSLVPLVGMVTGSNTKVVLSESEKTDITTQATAACGGGADQKCVAYHTNQLQSAKLQEKASAQQSSANIVTGRRLTVTYTDSKTGVQKTVAVPDGQAVTLGTPPALSLPAMPTLSGTMFTGLTTVGTIIAFLLYVLSIAISYRAMMLDGHVKTAYVLTALAILIPFSGFVTTPVAIAIFTRMGA